MADASKLKRRTSLGVPPPVEEASHNLHEPEIAKNPIERIDGRTLRRSGRTLQFATRVSPEFDARLRQIAQRDGLLLVEVLERALEAYEAAR